MMVSSDIPSSETEAQAILRLAREIENLLGEDVQVDATIKCAACTVLAETYRQVIQRQVLVASLTKALQS